MLPGARVLRLLDDDGRVLGQLACDCERGGERGVPRRPPLHPLELAEHLRGVEDLALRDEDQPVEVAERPGGVEGDVTAIGPDGEGEGETRSARS